MKKTKINESIFKKASGENVIAYDPIEHKTLKLVDEKDIKKINSDNIIEFQKISTGIEFQNSNDTRSREDFERVLFVTKALSKNKNEPIVYKTIVHVEKEENEKCTVIATDGARLHAAEVGLSLLPGNYTVHITKNIIALRGPIENDDISYPNWKKVYPANPIEKTIVSFEEKSILKNIFEAANMSRRLYSLIKNTKKLINLYYLNDLSKGVSWKVYVSTKMTNQPLLFKIEGNKLMFALIMPLLPEVK
jgi:hypothetical protein